MGRVKGTDKDDKAPMGLALLDAIATPWPEGTERVSGDRKPSRSSSPGEEQPPQVPWSYVEECAIASTLPVGWSRQSKYPGLSLFSPSSLGQLSNSGPQEARIQENPEWPTSFSKKEKSQE